jgi:hypothetical protein
MRNRRTSSGALFGIPAVLALAIFSNACFFASKKPVAFKPPPPQPASVAASVEHLPDPPLTVSVPDLRDPSIVPNGVSEAPAPPAPRIPPRRPSRPVATPPASPTPPAEQPVPPPKLGQIIPPEQSREYNRTIDECLDRVRRVVAAMARKNLTPEQAEILNRIQVFQRQAEENRGQDLVIAASLAKRADLLAKDLQERLP